MDTFVYPYALPTLPYGYDAFEPFIDEETMKYHHDKHFQMYINNLNDALKPYPQLHNIPLTKLLSRPMAIPQPIRQKVLNNGGGVYNHNLFFLGLAPASEPAHVPTGALLTAINRQFGSFDAFKAVFSKEALSVFGSGWTMLVWDQYRKLKIVNLINQKTALPRHAEPILLIDVWEHAYYLKYKNARDEYIANIWNVICFRSPENCGLG